MWQTEPVEFSFDEPTHRLIAQTLGDDRVGHAALEVQVHRQVQVGQQRELADQNQVVVLRKIFQQKTQPAKVLHCHQVRVVDDRDEHFAGSVEADGFSDQLAFALERAGFELDPERFTKQFDRVGVGVQRPRERGDQVLFFWEQLE